MCLANTPRCVVLTSAKNSKASQRKLQHADLRCGLRQFTSVRIRPNPSLQVLQKPFDHLICGPTEIDWGCHLEGEKKRHRLSKLNGLALHQFRARWPWHITCNQMFIIFYYDPPIPLEMLLFPGLWWEQNAPEPTSSCSALSENAAKGCNGLCSNIKHKSPERQVTWRSGSLQ